MRFPWVRAPSPPPWVEPSYWAFNLTFSVLFLIYMAVLYLGLQRRWVLSKYTVSAVVPIALGNILMGTALMPTCETPTVPALEYPFMTLLAVVSFALLCASEVATYLFNLIGPPAAFTFLRLPVLAVHLSTLLFYVFSAYDPACLGRDTFGRPLHPLRYVMWTTSVSCSVISVFFVAEDLTRKSRHQTRWNSTALHRECILAIMAVVLMFVTGYLATLRFATGLWANVVNYGASTVFMYLALGKLTHMLHLCATNPLVVQQQGGGIQFRLITYAIVVTWHAFPAVWVLGASNIVTPEIEHCGYVICDLLAKYVLLYVYSATVSNA
uniref:Uncharacterized protein n=1 Tax=Haptolina ericina TaxID=156174 RepID=A0A7S3B639_9EUKA|mmetsp:Transcript_49812/g.112010  ORF Transcript_49812/g.112010 Transcript_49812/m.112010 type:complete len:325 (+) Transcript_49812:35-1009(+)